MHCTGWRRSGTSRWYSRVTEVRTKELMHGLVKQTQLCVSFNAPCWRNGSFQTPQSFQFLNGFLFRSSFVAMNLVWQLKEYCLKNNQQIWYICGEFSIWHFVTKCTGLKSVKHAMSSHFSEARDPSYISSAMCPERPRKDRRSKSFGLRSAPTESGPELVQGAGGVTASPSFLGHVLVLSKQNYLRLLLIVKNFGSSRPAAPATPYKGKAGTKMREWTNM